jgi:hypothetical protein
MDELLRKVIEIKKEYKKRSLLIKINNEPDAEEKRELFDLLKNIDNS